MGATYVEDRDLCAAARAVDFFGIADLGGPDDPPPDDPPPDDPPPMGGDPTVAITNPVEGDEVGGVVQVEADADAPDGVARVEFTIDGVIKGSDATEPYTYRWATQVYDAGDHVVEATVVDAYGRTATASVSVTVSEDGGPGTGGGLDQVDPIPCGCAVRDTGDGLAVMAMALGVLLVITRRRRARG
jgi:MYXO-CTERM domain-containing protein